MQCADCGDEIGPGEGGLADCVECGAGLCRDCRKGGDDVLLCAACCEKPVSAARLEELRSYEEEYAAVRAQDAALNRAGSPCMECGDTYQLATRYVCRACAGEEGYEDDDVLVRYQRRTHIDAKGDGMLCDLCAARVPAAHDVYEKALCVTCRVARMPCWDDEADDAGEGASLSTSA
jgi:hypothetical protein